MRELAAVLCDMDGTIVDSDPYWIAAEHALVEEHGAEWTDADAQAIVGSALLDAAHYMRSRGVDLPAEEIVEQLLERVTAGVREETIWLPGARELLAELAEAGVPCALVTMSYRDLAETVAGQLPPGTFDLLITGDEVTRGKPHPEPYLLAAERLGVAPHDCLALEDSPTGVAAAEAAGCTTIALPRHAPVEALPGRLIARSITELGGLAGLRDLHARRRTTIR